MKKSKFTEAQIAFALKQAETGTRVDEVCRKMGISQATFFNWKKKYGGLGVSELRRLRQLVIPVQTAPPFRFAYFVSGEADPLFRSKVTPGSVSASLAY
jgi:putative transposase